MARQKHVKAAKDHPRFGIVKGDMHWVTHMKTGPRSSITKRRKTKFRPSELTTSPFKSGYLSAWESWAEGDRDAQAISDLAEALRDVGIEAQDSYDNLPENFQYGDTGQMLEERANVLEQMADELDGHAGDMQSLEDELPDLVAARDEAQTELNDHDGDMDDHDELAEARDDAQQEVDDKEAERADLRDEVDGLDDQPE